MPIQRILGALAVLAVVVIAFFFGIYPSFLKPSPPHISDPPVCGTPPIEECGPYSGVLITPPPTVRPRILLNNHSDAPILVFDGGDTLRFWLVGPDKQRYFVCQTNTVRALDDWYTTSHGYFQACHGHHLHSDVWFSVAYWAPHRVIVVHAYFPNTSTQHLEPYSITIDLEHNVYRNDQ